MMNTIRKKTFIIISGFLASLALAAPVAVSAHSGSSVPNHSVPAYSGIYGSTVYAPSSPDCTIGAPCSAPLPNATVLVETNNQGGDTRIVKRFTSDSTGHFNVQLQAGSYILIPVHSAKSNSGSPVHVTVKRYFEVAHYTYATVAFDSRIR